MRTYPFRLTLLALLALALAACNLSMGTGSSSSDPTPEPAELFISINVPEPTNGNAVTVDRTGFTVMGRQRGSFENNVVVQALDMDGNVLAQATTTATGEMGTVGNWDVFLTPDVDEGTRGTVMAFFVSPQDGSVVAKDELDVVYGTPDAE